MGGLLYAIVAILVVLWVFGFLVAHIGGPLIHLVLLIAAVVLVYRLVTGQRAI